MNAFAVAVLFCVASATGGCGGDSNESTETEERQVVEQPIDSTSSDQATISDLTLALRGGVPEDHLQKAVALLETAADPANVAAILGAEAYLNRYIDTAAWLYSYATERRPDDAIIRSNFGLTLTALALAPEAGSELTDAAAEDVFLFAEHKSAQPSSQPDYLDAAIEELQAAVRLAPDEPATHNNLGVALVEAERLEEAEAEFQRAIELDPTTSLYHSHLADLYARQVRGEEAATELARAHALDAYDGAALQLRGLAAQGSISIPAPAMDAMSHCDALTFSCATECPGGIIGGLNQVTCEMEQSSAVLSCRAGEPYPTTYNCDIDLAGVPFLLPGMFPGVSIVTPFGQLDMLVQGGGRIDFRVRVNVPGASGPQGGLDLTAAGRYDPHTGMSVTRVAPGASVNLYNRGTVAPVLNSAGIGPAAIKLDADIVGEQGAELRLDSYNTPMVHLH